jgi:hypothetical protein
MATHDFTAPEYNKQFDAGGPPNVESSPKKGTRSRPAKKRRYHETTVFKGKVAETLGVLHEAGHTFEFIVPSPDIRGVEVYSYTEE